MQGKIEDQKRITSSFPLLLFRLNRAPWWRERRRPANILFKTIQFTLCANLICYCMVWCGLGGFNNFSRWIVWNNAQKSNDFSFDIFWQIRQTQKLDALQNMTNSPSGICSKVGQWTISLRDYNLVPGILVLCKIWESNNLVSTSLRNSSRLIFPSSACCKFKMRKCKKKEGKIGRWWRQWWLFSCPAKQYANRSVRNRSVCVDGNVVLWEIFEIVLQEISGFKIFSPRLLLALSLSNFPNLIW